MSQENYGTVERRKEKVFPFHYSPGKKVVHVVAKLSDNPGALASLLNALGARLNLMSTTSYAVGDGSAISSSFGEALFDSDTARSIHKVASQSPHVTACEVWESKDGLLVDQFHQGLESMTGQPYIMLDRVGLARMFKQLHSVLGSGSSTLLYLQGKDYGRSRVDAYGSMLGTSPSTELQGLSHIFEALGHGSWKVETEPDGCVRLVSYDDFECCTHELSDRECSFSRGLAVGSIEALLGKEMTSRETRCRFRGDSECEFELTPRVSGNAITAHPLS